MAARQAPQRYAPVGSVRRTNWRADSWTKPVVVDPRRSAEVRVRPTRVDTGVGVPRLDRSNLGRVGVARGLLLIQCGRVRRERHRSIGSRSVQEPLIGCPYVPASGSPVAVQLDHPIDQVWADLGTHTGQGRSSLALAEGPIRAAMTGPRRAASGDASDRWVLRSPASGHPSRLGPSGAVAGSVGARVARGDTVGTVTRRGEAAAEPPPRR